jgi:radical SAM protein with 4Fe4S-binding SPASM domain
LQSRAISFYDKWNERKIDYSLNNPTFPKVVDIELTVLCNLRCRMCWWWGENGIGFKLLENKDPLIYAQLSREEIFSIIDQIAKYGPSLYLSGGEPFIRKDTIDIIEYAVSKGLSVSLTTNGTLIDEELAKKLAKIKNLRLTFSVDGPREIHDKIRGEGNFDKTITAIKYIKKYKDGLYPMLNTNTTFSAELLGHTEELIKELILIGVENISFQHLWFTDKKHAQLTRNILKKEFLIDDNSMESHIIETFSSEFIKKLAIEVEHLQNKRFRVPVRVNPRLSKEEIIKYYTDLNWSKKYFCNIPWTKILIKANGDAMFCPDEWITKYKLGNIRENSIIDLWNSNEAKRFREVLLRYKLFPICTRCCSINMS